MPHAPCGSRVDLSILLWVSQLDMRQADAMLFSTHCELTADVLRPVVDADSLWLARHRVPDPERLPRALPAVSSGVKVRGK